MFYYHFILVILFYIGCNINMRDEREVNSKQTIRYLHNICICFDPYSHTKKWFSIFTLQLYMVNQFQIAFLPDICVSQIGNISYEPIFNVSNSYKSKICLFYSIKIKCPLFMWRSFYSITFKFNGKFVNFFVCWPVFFSVLNSLQSLFAPLSPQLLVSQLMLKCVAFMRSLIQPTTQEGQLNAKIFNKSWNSSISGSARAVCDSIRFNSIRLNL